MKKNLRRAVSLLLCLIMLGGIMPLATFSADDEVVPYQKGDIIKFGSYPQSETTDIEGMTEGEEYKTVDEKHYRVEPIEWVVLDPATGLCVSKYGLDAKAFNSNFDNGNNYADSEIGTWLTGDFYDEAFTDDENVSKTFSIAPVSQPAPTGLSKTDETKCSASDGKITGVTTAMEFAYERGPFKVCKGTEITGLQPGTYSVRFSDDGNHTASEAVQLVIGKGACCGGKATCCAKAVCDGCGNEYGERNPDNHNCVQKYDSTNHRTECECGYTENTEAHKDADGNLRCDVCGYDLKEVAAIADFPTMAGVPYGQSITVKSESNYGKVIYTSSNPNVATVDENGTVTTNFMGECVITAQVEGTDQKTECTIKVSMTLWQLILYFFTKLIAAITSIFKA